MKQVFFITAGSDYAGFESGSLEWRSERKDATAFKAYELAQARMMEAKEAGEERPMKVVQEAI